MANRDVRLRGLKLRRQHDEYDVRLRGTKGWCVIRVIRRVPNYEDEVLQDGLQFKEDAEEWLDKYLMARYEPDKTE